MKKVIQGGTIINEGRQFQADLVIEGGKITQILAQAPETLLQEAQVIDASHCFVIPGVIDDQVHFREPGLTHKGNIGEGSRAAAAGGVTSFMDMPNVVPPTTTMQLLEEKQEIAGRTSLVNYSFYLGATTDNIGEIKRVNPRTTCGIKAFMGSSTGNMLIDSIPALERLFAESPLLIATHCEDTPTINHNLALYKAKYGDDIPPQYHPLIRSREACLKSSALAASLARKYNSRLHILHLSTADELTLLDSGKRLEKKITGEACVHHLWFNDEAYLTKGNFVKWNPAIKTEADRQALLEAVNQGVIDVIATDHAPHTAEEKAKPIQEAPSGIIGLETALALGITKLVDEGYMTMRQLLTLMSTNPANLYHLDAGYLAEGGPADIILIDTAAEWTPESYASKAGNTPFTGWNLKGKVVKTICAGKILE